MESALLEQLLHQPESQFLDFKQAQYPFVNGSEFQKSELLKDILAFANSWRHASAYVLIGVREVPGGRSEVVGVNDHLEDASLHQFVNSKTQRPVEFSYEVFRTDGLEIGVIEIPLQERPLYVRGTFGKVEAEAVYIRDGSSTRKATPDEIKRMGTQKFVEATPRLELSWADIAQRITVTSPYQAHTRLLRPLLPVNTFDLPPQRGIPAGLGPTPNTDYSQEIINFAFERTLFVPLGFVVSNDSRTVAKRVRLVGHIPVSGTLAVSEYLAPMPKKEYSLIPDVGYLVEAIGTNRVEPRVEQLQNRWEITVDFGDIRPRDSVYTSDCIWLCAAESTDVEVTGYLYGDNLPEPIQCCLQVEFHVENRPMEHGDVLPYTQH